MSMKSMEDSSLDMVGVTGSIPVAPTKEQPLADSAGNCGQQVASKWKTQGQPMTSPTPEGQRAEHSAQPNQLRLDMIAKLREIADRLESGCTNHGCGVRPKGGGMGTNGPCQCWEDAYRSAEWVATQLRQQPRHARRCFL